jgi:thiol-disulfide isomerase/thioredoxin
MTSRLFLAAPLLLALPLAALGAPEPGSPAPALVVKRLDGQSFDLAADRGRVTIVNFWATWCPPCRAEMPAFDAFHQAHPEVAMLGVSIDKSRDRDAVDKAATSVHYPLAMLTDAASNGFGKPAELPVTYVVDSGGVVRAVLTSDPDPVTQARLEQAVAPLLGAPASRPGGDR